MFRFIWYLVLFIIYPDMTVYPFTRLWLVKRVNHHPYSHQDTGQPLRAYHHPLGREIHWNVQLQERNPETQRVRSSHLPRGAYRLRRAVGQNGSPHTRVRRLEAARRGSLARRCRIRWPIHRQRQRGLWLCSKSSRHLPEEVNNRNRRIGYRL